MTLEAFEEKSCMKNLFFSNLRKMMPRLIHVQLAICFLTLKEILFPD